MNKEQAKSAMKQEWFVVHQLSVLEWSNRFNMYVWETMIHEHVTPHRATKDEATEDFASLGFKLRPTAYVQCHDTKDGKTWERHIVQCETTFNN